MQVEQISIFLENKTGRLAEVTSILSEAGVNIRALSLADTSDFGVLRLIVDNNKKAEEALKSKGFTLNKTRVVAVEVQDKPGGLNKILSLLDKSGVNVEYMYAFVRQSKDNAVMIFRFDNTDEAIKLLKDGGITVIEGSKVYMM
ncbi:MAG: ACT domain-containing protein [Thermodesulfobacteriota bacterium]|nr:ACT domain-containing protein [Thermodesulfobacteriota bacterium]